MPAALRAAWGDNGAATRKVTAPLDRAAEGAIAATRTHYARPGLRRVRPSTSKRMWLGSDRDRPSIVDSAKRPRSVKVQGRT